MRYLTWWVARFEKQRSVERWCCLVANLQPSWVSVKCRVAILLRRTGTKVVLSKHDGCRRPTRWSYETRQLKDVDSVAVEHEQ